MSKTPQVTRKSFSAMKNELTRAGALAIRLASNSMAPVLPTGTVAEIMPVTFEELKPLDCIVYDAGELLVCHVVWGFGLFLAANGERTVLTRGLSVPFFDEPVRESRILGRVTSHQISKRRFVFISLLVWAIAKLGLRPQPLTRQSRK